MRVSRRRCRRLSSVGSSQDSERHKRPNDSASSRKRRARKTSLTDGSVVSPARTESAAVELQARPRGVKDGSRGTLVPACPCSRTAASSHCFVLVAGVFCFCRRCLPRCQVSHLFALALRNAAGFGTYAFSERSRSCVLSLPFSDR